MHGENENGGAVVVAGNLSRRFQSAHDRHGDVHDDSVRAQRFGELDSFLSVNCFAANFPVGTSRQNRTYPLAHHFMVINNEDSNWHKKLTPYKNYRGQSLQTWNSNRIVWDSHPIS